MSAGAHDGLGAKLLAGGLSCMLISAILNPMDVVKVALQTQNQLKPSATGSTAEMSDLLLHPCRSLHDRGLYRGSWDAMKSIYLEQGYGRGLMKGITASMLREASYSSIRMGLYDSIKILLAPSGTDKDQIRFTHKLMAGAGSGAIGSFIATPTDLVKIRFQSFSPRKRNPYRNTFHAFSSIVRDEHGIRGLYKGASPTIVRAGLLTSVQLSSYDHSKRVMIRRGYFQDNLFTHIIASLLSGLVTTTVVNPVDVIKTRIMCDATMNKSLYTSSTDCLSKTLINEGWLSLMKGWLPNYLRIGPHSLLSLPLLEFIRRALGTDPL